jgi:pyruvate/2-oxoacid:ferredoxin oxidoreductase alpha subunit
MNDATSTTSANARSVAGTTGPQAAPLTGGGTDARPRVLIKGNEAAVRGALLAGCRCFFGYPITPASEIAHEAARLFPLVGGQFLQAESEVASINMVYGAAAAGARVMSASSSPGISLMQEGLSYSAGSELPVVVININRGGPGLGNIGPEQSDYFQMTKGGGHGNYRVIVLAPNSVQEMCDLTMLAFELADKYRNPACVQADGVVGQMMEPLALPEPRIPTSEPDWAVRGDKETSGNLISSIFLAHEVLEQHIQKLDRKYQEIQAHEVRYETYQIEDADIVLIAYGIVSRIAQGAVDAARARGIKAGLLRPITLWPFPTEPLAELSQRVKHLLTVELSTGQMIEDVKLAAEGRCPVSLQARQGGVLPSVEDVTEKIVELAAAGGKGVAR